MNTNDDNAPQAQYELELESGLMMINEGWRPTETRLRQMTRDGRTVIIMIWEGLSQYDARDRELFEINTAAFREELP